MHAHQRIAWLHQLPTRHSRSMPAALHAGAPAFAGDTADHPAVDVGDDAGFIGNHVRRYRLGSMSV